jgi:serine/threonine protein kinase/Tfp pilus assembly protein PilF
MGDSTQSTASTQDGHPRPGTTILPPGTRVGRYVLLADIGIGGMGVVYKAYDPQLERPIALKLLRAAGDDEAAQRFRQRLLREAQALAQLSHPNVVAVHDVGTFGEGVFVAMEFIEGQTLVRWCQAEPRSKPKIVELYLAAGEGLAAAHRAGLVHRDFKPENVLVGDDGRVRVLDFGLVRVAASESAPARATAAAPANGDGEAVTAPIRVDVDSTRITIDEQPRDQEKLNTSRLLTSPLTHEGSIMGTPRFMAPEQHLSQPVDERADQFSFCVSLYEALYGTFPFAGTTVAELRLNVTAGNVLEPPPGARVPRFIRAALLRGLMVKPGDRYPSMAALLEALRADPRVTRDRWLRAAAALLLVGTAAFGWRALRSRDVRACAGAEAKLDGVWDSARRAAVRNAFHKSDKPYAEAALASVEKLFDAYAAQWVAMHVDTCEATHVRGEQSQELLDLRMTCLGDRLTQLNTLADVFTSADGSVVERAVQSAQSLPSLELCADVAALRAPIPPPREAAAQRRVESVRQQLSRASALGLLARYDDGLRLTRAALADAQALHYAPIEAEAELRLGALYDDEGGNTDAVNALYRALVAGLAGHHDEVAAQATIRLIRAIGDGQAHYEEGERWAGIAEALVSRVQRKNELLGAFLINRSKLRIREGRYDDSLGDATQGLKIVEQLFGSDDYRVADANHMLGMIYIYKADYQRSLDSYNRSLAINQRILGADHPKIITDLAGIGGVYVELGEYERAIEQYQRAITAIKKVRTDHPIIPVMVNNMGEALLSLNRPEEAFAQFQLAFADWQKRLGPSHELTIVYDNLGNAKLAMKQPEEGLRYLHEGLEMCDHVLGHKHNACGQLLTDMGEAYRQLGKLDLAMTTLKESLAIREKAMGPTHPELIAPLLAMGRVEIGRGNRPAARPLLERAVALVGAKPSDQADARFLLAQELRSDGETERAMTLARQAQEFYAKARSARGDSLAAVTAFLDRH